MTRWEQRQQRGALHLFPLHPSSLALLEVAPSDPRDHDPQILASPRLYHLFPRRSLENLWCKGGNPRWLRLQNLRGNRRRKILSKKAKPTCSAYRMVALGQLRPPEPLVGKQLQLTSRWPLGVVVPVVKRTRRQHQNCISQQSKRKRPAYLNLVWHNKEAGTIFLG